MSQNKAYTYNQLTERKQNPAIHAYSVREIFARNLYLIPWLFVSVGIALSIAYARLRYINPVYTAAGRVLIKTDKPGGNVFGEKLGEVVSASVNTRLMDDQIELIKSTALARLVVRSADLQTTYYYKGKLRNRLIHNPFSPIRLKVISIKDSLAGFSMNIQVLGDNSFTINGANRPVIFGKDFENQFGVFRLEKQIQTFGDNKEFIVTWIPELDLARGLASGIQVGVVTKGGNVLNFIYSAEHPKVAEDIVNGFLNAYQEYSLKDKREGALSALDFIETQLKESKADLGELEMQLQMFREANKVVVLSEQGSRYFSSLQLSGDKIAEQTIRIKSIDFLIDYIAEPKNSGKSIPLIPEVTEGALSELISSYNKFQLQREIQLQTIPLESPVIKDLNLTLGNLKKEVLSSLASLRGSFMDYQQNLKDNEDKANSALRNLPRKEKALLEITRQQKVMEELYATLLQKKLQTSISTASTLSNIQLLESGYSSGLPVSPRPRAFYGTAILLGIIIPVGMAFLLEFLNDKIRTKQDIEAITHTPILGEIGHIDGNRTLVISSRDRKFISEQFRIIRTSLQYILSDVKKTNVILVSSCMSGEGKSFVATNMAAVLAISGKRTVLIEFDIRKPRLMKGLGLDGVVKNGLTHYLIGKSGIEDIIQKVDDVDNLHIIPCGLIPPNPAELILNERLSHLFDALEQKFDVVIVDSPPVGLVSDGYVLGKYADATLFVLRHNYTFKKQLALVQSIYEDKKLPHMSIVINDVQAPLGYNHYAGYVNYGYGGYGYGYKNDLDQYFESEKLDKFKWLKRLFR